MKYMNVWLEKCAKKPNIYKSKVIYILKMSKLDLKDRKILFELDSDSRQSFHKIAKKVGLSKDSVIYRIKKLQKQGIIHQFQTLLNTGKLGFISFRLYLKLQNTTPETEKELLDFLKKEKIVAWIASIEGDYGLAMWLLVKTIKQANDFWKKLLKNYGDFIAKRWLTIFTKVAYYPRVFLLDKKQNLDEYVFVMESEQQEVDEIDLKLLELIAPNSRISVLELAKKLKITPKTTSSRIKSLEKRKVIIGYRTLFDLEQLGYQQFKLLIRTQNITDEKEKQFRGFVKQHPNIVYDNEVLGGEDFEIELQLKGIQEFRNFVDELKERFHDIIKEYSYFVFYKEHKFVFFPVLEQLGQKL